MQPSAGIVYTFFWLPIMLPELTHEAEYAPYGNKPCWLILILQTILVNLRWNDCRRNINCRFLKI